MVVPLCLDGTLLYRPRSYTDDTTVLPVRITRLDPTDTLILVTGRSWGRNYEIRSAEGRIVAPRI